MRTFIARTAVIVTAIILLGGVFVGWSAYTDRPAPKNTWFCTNTAGRGCAYLTEADYTNPLYLSTWKKQNNCSDVTVSVNTTATESHPYGRFC